MTACAAQKLTFYPDWAALIIPDGKTKATKPYIVTLLKTQVL